MIDSTITSTVKCDEPGCGQQLRYELRNTSISEDYIEQLIEFINGRNWQYHGSGQEYCPKHHRAQPEE